jgi:hypothetical protein
MVFNHNPRATITTTLNNENTLTFNDELLTFGQYRAPGLSVFFDGGSFGFCGVRGLSFGGLVLGFVLVVWCFVAVFVVCRVPAMFVPPPLIRSHTHPRYLGPSLISSS